MNRLNTLIMTAITTIAMTALVCGLTFTGYSQDRATGAKDAPSKMMNIGIATPLTGPMAPLGAQMKNAAVLAIEDQNSKGGVTIGGQKYRVNGIIMDTKKDPKEAKSVAEQLIFEKNVKLVIGPAVEDAISMQPILEANKVMGFFLQPIMPEMSGPDKHYTFFYAGPMRLFYNITVAYIQKFYPKAKTIVSVLPDLADTPMFIGTARMMCERYGLKWLAAEKFPMTTRDFTPIITRVLAHNPDIIDTASVGGTLGGSCAVLIKQLREAGFKGLIMVPAPPPPTVILEAVPEQYRTGIIINDVNPESAIVPDAYRNLYRRFSTRFPETKEAPHLIVGKIYNITKAFFDYIDGRDKIDTTVWTEGFANLRWKNLWGKESFFCGKPIWGANRMAMGTTLVSEYTNGKWETKWDADVPTELYYTK